MTKRLCFFFFPFSPKPQHPFVSKAMFLLSLELCFLCVSWLIEIKRQSIGSRSAFLPWLFSSVMIILVSDIIKKT